jgi:hypothetical protein
MRRRKRILITALAVLFAIGFSGMAGKADAQSGPTLDLSWVQEGIRSLGYITSQPFPYLATIVGSQDAVWNLSEGELIYIKLASGKKVMAGDRLAVARVSSEIKHPLTDKKIGHAVIFPGRIVVLDDNGPIVPAKIEKSFGPINHGDMISALPPSPPPVVSIRTQDSLQGIVISAAEEEWNISEREVVFIDRGTQDGVIRGDIFSIYSAPYYTEETEKSKEKLPLLKVGEGVVITATPETSTMLVTKSTQAIYAGDTIVSGKGK